ncbi:GNAT family N-acetyltransferase [Paraglaciecola sp.]|uniref:GNAT family N-acetyltransferase n=1 Tax=Paraglaciecola sp. TaxID=1920173 RepID=UPI0030F43D6A
MKNVIIRRALIEERAVLLKLEQHVITAERPFNSAIKPNNAVYYDLDSLYDDTAILLVAELAGQIVGTGYGQIRDSKASLKHSKHAYLGFMFVVAEFRGLGINKLIMENLISWSKEQKVFDIYLDVYDANHAAIKAYEKVGFTKSKVEMKINLENN